MQTWMHEDIGRREAWEKVSGRAKYCDDVSTPDQLTARILTSPHAHARVLSVAYERALEMPGVKAVVTGGAYPALEGILLKDRPPLALDRVRYAGEPVALVVAMDEAAAVAALSAIEVSYAPLAPVLNPTQALASGAPLLHEALPSYVHEVQDIYPQPHTNIASRYQIRKGDAGQVLGACDVTVHQRFSLPPSGHLAMEVRTAHASITPDGEVNIVTSSQSPFTVQEQVAAYFGLPTGKVRVHVPLVGGGFGGKAPVMLEHLAYMASKAVGGRPVRVILTREQDMATAPCRMGFEADIKLGASQDGTIQAAEMTYWLDCGAYTDISPYMSKAAAADCTGPYRIDNLSCDSLCVYSNHTYVTSYRGFVHESYTFCLERALDMLAKQCGVDPFTLRHKNALRPGHMTPTQVEATASNLGDLPACLEGVKTLSGWEEGDRIQINERTVRAKGISCLWKAANPPTNAPSGAFLTFNADGSINMNVGVVEMGNGDQSRLAHMLAVKFRMDIDMIHVNFKIDTRIQPKHWKTVASLSEFLAGHALMRAADDAIAQLTRLGAQALQCAAEDVEMANARIYKKEHPGEYFHFQELVGGYTAPDGASVGDPVLGRGSYMLKGLTALDEQTGQGKTGPSWTVGAQVVEVELDTVDYTYRILNASTVMDIGAVVSPKSTAAMIAGGMAMGISMGSREAYCFDACGRLTTPNLRTYKLLHIGQEPDYRVGLVATSQEDAPFGLRSFSEHGIIGAAAALGNALSTALERPVNALPLVPELLWKTAEGMA